MQTYLFNEDQLARLEDPPGFHVPHVRSLLVKVDTKLKDDVGKAIVNNSNNSSKMLNISETAIVTFLNQLD